MQRKRSSQRGSAMLETVLLWMVVVSMTLTIGTKIQQAESRMMHAAFDPVISALN